MAATDCFTLKNQVDESLREVFAAIRKRQEVVTRAALSGAGTDPEGVARRAKVPAPDKAGKKPKDNRFWTGTSRQKKQEHMVS